MSVSEVNNISLLQTIKGYIDEQSKSIKSVFPELLSKTFSLPIVDRNLPEESVARIAHISKETLTLFAKALVVGAAIYTVSLTFTFLKVLAVGVVFSSIIYKVSQNKEYMDAFAKKAHQFWSSISAPKAPQVTEVVELADVEKKVEVSEVDIKAVNAEEIKEVLKRLDTKKKPVENKLN